MPRSPQKPYWKRFWQFIAGFLADHKRSFVGAALAFIYFLLAGYLPAYYIQKDFIDGEVFVNLYSHLFRYGQFFGWITVLFLVHPVLHLWNTEKQNKKTLFSILAIFIVISSAVVIIDFQSDNMAPHEIRPDILQSDDRLRGHFTKKGGHDESDKLLYQSLTVEILKDRANWSYARYLHYLAIFLHTFSLLFILSVVVWLIIYGSSKKIRENEDYKRSLVYCSYTILISSLWLLMRIAFNYQREFYFVRSSNPAAEYLFLVIFLMGSLVVILLLSTTFIKEFTQAITIAGFVFAGLNILLDKWDPAKLLELFGKDANTLNYWTILVGILMLSGIIVLVRNLSGIRHSKELGARGRNQKRRRTYRLK